MQNYHGFVQQNTANLHQNYQFQNKGTPVGGPDLATKIRELSKSFQINRQINNTTNIQVHQVQQFPTEYQNQNVRSHSKMSNSFI